MNPNVRVFQRATEQFPRRLLIMLFKSFLIAAVLPFLATAYEDPLVTLDYVSLQGKYNEAYNISYFRRIPFAAPPVGENRFRGPQPVGTFDGTYDADIPVCLIF